VNTCPESLLGNVTAGSQNSQSLFQESDALTTTPPSHPTLVDTVVVGVAVLVMPLALMTLLRLSSALQSGRL